MTGKEGYWIRQFNLRLARRRVLQVAGVAAAGFGGAALLGCSDDSNKGSGSSGNYNTGTLTGKETPVELQDRFSGRRLKDLPGQKDEPKYGGIHRRSRNAPPSWDLTSPAAVSLGFYQYVHNTPMSLEVHELGKDPFAYHLEPTLVKSWERAGATTLVLRIDEAAKWQNVPPVNGREFMAADLAYAFEVYRKTPGQQFIYRDVDRIETPDNKTVRLQLRQPAAYLEQQLSTPYNQIFSREQHESSEGLSRRPIGAGPFIFESGQDRVGVKFRKNPDYWQKDPYRGGKQIPYLDGLELVYLADTTAIVAAFRDKQLDGIGAPDRTTWESIIDGHPEYVSEISPPPPGYEPSIAYRLDKEPWNDVRVRRAMSLTIDRQSIIESYGGLAIPAYSQDWSYYGRDAWKLEDLGPWSKFDPAQSKQLMSAAGFANGMGRKVPIWLNGSTGAQNYDIPVLVTDAWRRHLNLETELKIAQDSATWNRTFYGKMYEDLAAPGFLTLGFEQDEMVYGTLHSKAPSNFTFVNDPTMDDLVIKQGNELNKSERQKILKQVMERDLDQQFRTWTVALNLIHIRQPYTFNYLATLYGGPETVSSHGGKYLWLNRTA